VGVMKRLSTARGEHGRGLAYDAEIKRRMAGGKKDKQQIYVTGFDDIDQALVEFEDSVKKKFIKQATRAGIKEDVLPEYQRIMRQEGLVETGAAIDVPKISPAKVKRGSGKIGHALYIDRNLLIAVRSAKGGRIGYDKKRNEAFYYLAAIEFGTRVLKAIAPLRKAAAAARQAFIDKFRKAMQASVDAAAVGKQKKRSSRKDNSTLLESVGLKKTRRKSS